MKLDLNAVNVQEVELTREEARKILDGEEMEKFEYALDTAQGNFRFLEGRYRRVAFSLLVETQNEQTLSA